MGWEVNVGSWPWLIWDLMLKVVCSLSWILLIVLRICGKVQGSSLVFFLYPLNSFYHRRSKQSVVVTML